METIVSMLGFHDLRREPASRKSLSFAALPERPERRLWSPMHGFHDLRREPASRKSLSFAALPERSEWRL